MSVSLMFYGAPVSFSVYWKGKVEENAQLLAKREIVSQAVESRRHGQPKGTKELFGMEGSFRKLEID